MTEPRTIRKRIVCIAVLGLVAANVPGTIAAFRESVSLLPFQIFGLVGSLVMPGGPLLPYYLVIETKVGSIVTGTLLLATMAGGFIVMINSDSSTAGLWLLAAAFVGALIVLSAAAIESLMRRRSEV